MVLWSGGVPDGEEKEKVPCHAKPHFRKSVDVLANIPVEKAVQVSHKRGHPLRSGTKGKGRGGHSENLLEDLEEKQEYL